MAKYYIVKRTVRPLPPPEELDWELVDETEETAVSRPWPWPLKILIVAMLGIFLWSYSLMVYSYRDSSLSDLYSNSQQLKEQLNQQLLQAVVKIEVVKQNGEQAQGTGFNLAPEGQIVTNYHVLEGAKQIMVRFPGQVFFYNGINWKGKQDYDLALISLNSSDLPYVPTNENWPLQGEKVTIVGNPLHLNQIAVEGTVGPPYQREDQEHQLMLILAPIYPGNSGSPVYNAAGEVVAVIFATLNQKYNDQIMGLAIPISYFYQELF